MGNQLCGYLNFATMLCFDTLILKLSKLIIFGNISQLFMKHPSPSSITQHKLRPAAAQCSHHYIKCNITLDYNTLVTLN